MEYGSVETLLADHFGLGHRGFAGALPRLGQAPALTQKFAGLVSANDNIERSVLRRYNDTSHLD